MSDVHVVIATYNCVRWLDRCLGSLRARGLAATTVVIDNGSSDGTRAAIAERYPEVSLLKSERNVGFGAANNRGISRALRRGARYVLLLNHDAWLVDDGLESALGLLDRDERIAVVSPVHVQADGRTLDPLFRRHLERAGLDADRLARGGVREPLEVPFVNAAAWLLPRAALLQLGGFSPLFTHYGEDREFASRLRHHGYRTVVLPAWRVVHDRGDRPLGWRDAPQASVRGMSTGLTWRLADPARGTLGRLARATAWQVGNVASALRAGYWAALPQAARQIADAVRQGQRRRVLRRQVLQPGPHFLALDDEKEWA